MTTLAVEAGQPITRGRALLERLLTRGCEFDFFQAIWLLERYGGGDHVPTGERGPVARELLRFRPDVWMGFPSTDVRRIMARANPQGGEPFYQVDVTFLGLYGVSTPLPLHYAVDVLRSVVSAPATAEAEPGARQSSEEDVPLGAGPSPSRDFLDVVHHRLISLFYRSWIKYHYDRSFGLPQRDVLTAYLLWLIGCSPKYDEAVLGVAPLRLLRYAGILTQHPRSSVTLEGLLKDYWSVDFQVKQFIGRWVTLPTADLNRMGLANSRLGVDLTAGEQVYDLTGAFNIVMGPVDWATYTSFLPDGEKFSQLQALTRLYCIDPLAFTVEIKLRAGEVPETRLGSGDEAGRLGFTSWVRTVDVPETSVTFDASATPRRAASAKTAAAPANPKAASPSATQQERPEPLYSSAETRLGGYAR